MLAEHVATWTVLLTAGATHTPLLPPTSTVTSLDHVVVDVVHEVLFTLLAAGFTASVVEPPAGTSEATAFSISACPSTPSIRNLQSVVTLPSRTLYDEPVISTVHAGMVIVVEFAGATHTPLLPHTSTVTSLGHGANAVCHEVLFTLATEVLSVLLPSFATAFKKSAFCSNPSIKNVQSVVTEPSEKL